MARDSTVRMSRLQVLEAEKDALEADIAYLSRRNVLSNPVELLSRLRDIDEATAAQFQAALAFHEPTMMPPVINRVRNKLVKQLQQVENEINAAKTLPKTPAGGSLLQRLYRKFFG